MDLDWKSLGFHYTETDYMVYAAYHDGAWGEVQVTRNKYIRLHAAATVLQYGQEAFEGLKAFRGADGRIRIFRMQANADRLQTSAQGLYMVPVPAELFREAIYKALLHNLRYLPPYESGATLYFRPLLIGTTPRLGVGPGRDFLFIILTSPIGPYFPCGFKGTPYIINRWVDRAAPLGTGQFKFGGNYAASFRATEPAHAAGFSCIFLDAKQKRFIDECGAANFFGIRWDEKKSRPIYVTPKSSSILPSITNDSLMRIAKDLGYKVEQRRVPVEELAEFTECAACGTAAVIAPISKVIDPDTNQIYDFGTEPGQVCCTLYNHLLDIQYGRRPDKHHWCEIVE